MDNTAQEQAKLLLFVLIQRHWAMHGESLSGLFKSMPGSLPAQMNRQVQGMESERDGMRKAILLHGILKSLIGHQVDRIITQLSLSSSSALNRSGNSSLVQEDFEQSLQQLTSAAKILYGSPVILVDEVLSRYSMPSDEGPSDLKSRPPSAIHIVTGLSPRLTPRASPRPLGPSSLSIKEAQRQQDAQIIKLFNMLKQKMPELSRSYLADHPSIGGLGRRSMAARAAVVAKRDPDDDDVTFVSPDPTLLPAGSVTMMAPGGRQRSAELMSLGRSVSFAALSPFPDQLLDEEIELLNRPDVEEAEDPNKLVVMGKKTSGVPSLA
jgi:hypothetical protein